MRRKSNATRSRAETFIAAWSDSYVSGRWTLAEFESHLEALLPKLTPEDWLPRPERPGRMRSPKQAARAWSESAAAASRNYVTATELFEA